MPVQRIAGAAGVPGLVVLRLVLLFAVVGALYRILRACGLHPAAAVALLPVAGLLNPHGPAMLLFPFRQNTMTRLTAFAEWKGPWFIP